MGGLGPHGRILGGCNGAHSSYHQSSQQQQQLGRGQPACHGHVRMYKRHCSQWKLEAAPTSHQPGPAAHSWAPGVPGTPMQERSLAGDKDGVRAESRALLSEDEAGPPPAGGSRAPTLRLEVMQGGSYGRAHASLTHSGNFTPGPSPELQGMAASPRGHSGEATALTSLHGEADLRRDVLLFLALFLRRGP